MLIVSLLFSSSMAIALGVELLPVVTLSMSESVAWLLMRAETLKGHLDGILLAVLEPGRC